MTMKDDDLINADDDDYDDDEDDDNNNNNNNKKFRIRFLSPLLPTQKYTPTHKCTKS